MTERRIRTTIVNHVARHIPVPPDVVWDGILDEYVQANKFREIGYTVEPHDDPAAVEGSYRMRLEQDGVVVDDRICRITELDDKQRRLSMFADCLTNGMVIYVTYQAAEATDRTNFVIDCHSSLFLDLPDDADPEAVRTAVHDLQAQFDAALTGYLDGIRAKLQS